MLAMPGWVWTSVRQCWRWRQNGRCAGLGLEAYSHCCCCAVALPHIVCCLLLLSSAAASCTKRGRTAVYGGGGGACRIGDVFKKFNSNAHV